MPSPTDSSILCHGLSWPPILERVLQEHPYLYRLERSPDQCLLPSGDLMAYKFRRHRDIASLPPCTPGDLSFSSLHQHICMWKLGIPRGGTPWISTTINFMYMMYEGLRRDTYHWRPEPDLKVVIIDSSLLDCDAHPVLLASQALRESASSASEDAEQAKNFSNSFQEVLIYSHIPKSAIVAIIPWTVVRDVTLARYSDITLVPKSSFSYFSEASYEAISQQLSSSRLDDKRDALQFAIELVGDYVEDNGAVAAFATSFYLWNRRFQSREVFDLGVLKGDFFKLTEESSDLPSLFNIELEIANLTLRLGRLSLDDADEIGGYTIPKCTLSQPSLGL